MARQFNGTDETCEFDPGDIAGVHEYGTIAMLFKRDGTSGASWRCPIYTGNGGVSNWGLCCDINTGNVMWFGLGTGESTDSTALNSTSVWYLVIIVKPNGASQTVRFHYRVQTSGTWGSWTHVNGSGTVSNSTTPTVSTIFLGSFAGFDYFNGDMAAAAVYRNWAPNDAAVEAIDWTSGIQEWVDAAANASAGAWVVCPGQAATSSPIQDLISDGHETTSDVGTVADDPSGFDVNLDTGDILLEAAIDGTSTFTADLQVSKQLAATIAASSTFQSSLRADKRLASTISSTSEFTADMELANEFEAVIASTSDFTASLQVEKQLASVIAGTSEFEASMLQVIQLAALIEGTSDFTATMAGLGNELASSIVSTSTFTAALEVAKELETTIESTSDFRARLNIGQQTPFTPRFQVVVWGRNKWFDPQFDSIGV